MVGVVDLVRLDADVVGSGSKLILCSAFGEGVNRSILRGGVFYLIGL